MEVLLRQAATMVRLDPLKSFLGTRSHCTGKLGGLGSAPFSCPSVHAHHNHVSVSPINQKIKMAKNRLFLSIPRKPLGAGRGTGPAILWGDENFPPVSAVIVLETLTSRMPFRLMFRGLIVHKQDCKDAPPRKYWRHVPNQSVLSLILRSVLRDRQWGLSCNRAGG